MATTATMRPTGKAPAEGSGAPQRPPRLRPSRTPWRRRLLEAVSTYLPLLLMGFLAMSTWWLVENTPLPTPDAPPRPPRHEPDYTMGRFTLQRFAPGGPLRTEVHGDELRHYPDTDTVEIDNVRMRSIGENGAVTHATALRALSNGDGSEVQLTGTARVHREATAGEEAVTFTSEFLHAFLNTEQVRSHLPMTLERGGTRLAGDSFRYDNLNRVVVVNGHVSATFPPSPPPAPRVGSAPSSTRGGRP